MFIALGPITVVIIPGGDGQTPLFVQISNYLGLIGQYKPTGKQLSKCLSCQNVGFCKFGSRSKVFTCLMLKRCYTLKKVFILHSLKSRTRGGEFCRFWST